MARWNLWLAIAATVSITVAADQPPCSLEPAKSLPFCNPQLSLDERVKDLISHLSLEEKMTQFANGAGAIDSLNIPAYQWWSEALHGVAGSPGVTFDGKITCATSFPQVSLSASSLNTTLWNLMGQAVSTEARAMANQGQAGLTFWAPNINIFRDPRWGRGQETPGEDPYITGQYATAYVSGLQESSVDPKHLKVSSCCKHYFDYNLENWDGVDRHHFDAITTLQDIRETYLPTFESCVRHGHGSSLMCSYNEVNGVPSCANSEIMNKMARQEWGFDGYITSDCGAVADVFDTHNYTKTKDLTCDATLSAGMDIDCGSFLQSNLNASVQDGSTKMSVVDQALYNQFKVRFRLGQFDPVEDQPFLKIGPESVNTEAHRQLALDAARQGIVLLKNNNDALPLTKEDDMHLAVLGPLGNATHTMQGNYFGDACWPVQPSPQDYLANYASTTFVSGCDDVACANSDFTSAVAVASVADKVVLFVGLDQGQESEGHDRVNLTLPGNQLALAEQVADAAKEPIILVIMSGGPVDVTPLRDSDKVAAILWVGYPGQAGAQAISEVLFGDTNPSGRLTMTWYPQEFAETVSMFNVNMHANSTTGYPGRTYRFYRGTPVFRFMSGLSYTTFNVTFVSTNPLIVNRKDVEDYIKTTQYTFVRGGEHDLVVDNIFAVVTNNGSRAGAYSYVLITDSGLPKVTEMGRVFLEVGESKRIVLEIRLHDLTAVDSDGNRYALSGEVKFSLDGQTRTVFVE